jgi:hypothetical protein
MDEQKKKPGEGFTVSDRRGIEDPPKPAPDLARVLGGVDASKIGVKSENNHPFLVAAREGRYMPLNGRVLLRAVQATEDNEEKGGSIIAASVGHTRGALYHRIEAIAPDVVGLGLRVGDEIHHISAAEDRLDERDDQCPYTVVLAKHIVGAVLRPGDSRLTAKTAMRDREAHLREKYGAGLPDDTPIEVLERLEAQERLERRQVSRWPDKLD